MDTRDPRYRAERRDEAARLYREERLTEREVAERMGVSKTQARRYLKDAGVRPRRRGRRRQSRRRNHSTS